MKKDEARLGKGLGAIFGEDLSNVIEEIQQGDESRQSEIKLSEIRPNPYQPRKYSTTRRSASWLSQSRSMASSLRYCCANRSKATS